MSTQGCRGGLVNQLARQGRIIVKPPTLGSTPASSPAESFVLDTTTPPQPHRMLVISALGVTQILAWGSSYYLLTILAKPIAAETGWPFAWVISGLSMGLLVSGVVSPQIGRAIERHGGTVDSAVADGTGDRHGTTVAPVLAAGATKREMHCGLCSIRCKD